MNAREQTIANFRTLSRVPITRVTQRGRDVHTSHFTLELEDGASLRLTSQTLWSHSEFSRAVAVGLQRGVHPCKPAAWRTAVEALVVLAAEVEETPGESFADTLRDWLESYIGSASRDRDGAAAGGLPFHHDGDLYVKAAKLATYVRREYSQKVEMPELYDGLRDLGFSQATVHYTKRTAKGAKRTTTSYYRIALDDFTAETEE